MSDNYQRDYASKCPKCDAPRELHAVLTRLYQRVNELESMNTGLQVAVREHQSALSRLTTERDEARRAGEEVVAAFANYIRLEPHPDDKAECRHRAANGGGGA